MVVYDSKVMAIPITTSLVFLMYHRGIFERDGLTPPRTWDEVLALADAYNGKGMVPYRTALSEGTVSAEPSCTGTWCERRYPCMLSCSMHV